MFPFPCPRNFARFFNENSQRQRTKFAHFTCISFAQYCMLISLVLCLHHKCEPGFTSSKCCVWHWIGILCRNVLWIYLTGKILIKPANMKENKTTTFSLFRICLYQSKQPLHHAHMLSPTKETIRLLSTWLHHNHWDSQNWLQRSLQQTKWQ